VQDVVALYRMQPGSASTMVNTLWRDGLRVITQGHSPDPRVSPKDHKEGEPREQLANARYEYACWIAGYVIGQAGDPSALLADLRNERDPGLNPEIVAAQLCETVPLASGRSIDAWDELWPNVEHSIARFLDSVERQSGAQLFARRTMSALERLTLEVSRATRPFARGRTLAIAVDVVEPLKLIDTADGVDRAHCIVMAGTERIGSVLIPLSRDSDVNRATLADEIATRFAWPVLNEFFKRGPYRELELRRDPRGTIVLRDGIVVGAELTDDEVAHAARFHDKIGWNVFLQELWGRPRWHGARFYDANAEEKGLRDVRAEKQCITIEASGDVPTIVTSEDQPVDVDVRLGGAPLGLLTLTPRDCRIGPAQLRAAITQSGVFELCRVAVREGILRGPSTEKALEQRLRVRAQQTRTEQKPSIRHLPTIPNETSATSPRPFDRHHFEAVFANSSDPWSYVTPYEQRKYEQTLALIPDGTSRLLEIACAEGRFTAQVAARAKHVLATDISSVALARAQTFCSDLPNVTFAQLDMLQDPIPAGYDVIVCSEVLYYTGSVAALKDVAAKLRDALIPDGRLVLAHTNVVVDDANETGLAWDVPFGAKRIGGLLAEVEGLYFEQELRTELYRVQVFRRRESVANQKAPVVVEHADHIAPAPHVAARFRRGNEGGSLGAVPDAPITRQVPILMYHHIGKLPNGSSAPTRYTVTCEMFEAQLRYLNEAGFRAATLEEWASAMHFRKPLRGRCVIITVDDAYADFGDHALPLLRKYDLKAHVFVPVAFIGQHNAWERAHAPRLPITDWEGLHAMVQAGVVIGAHSMTHSPMTGLTNDQLQHEVLHSKQQLESRLQRPVLFFAYPHGDNDPIVQRRVAEAGYALALTTRFGRAGFHDARMALPRIEVTGHDDLTTFISKIGA
jgi:peptidoglycan/xylan/chitin deacetylase (PgdA/CDA1 family)/2-polyprenyl-3-methyl-5-hydroxy-6-metoxy-1,4-benzoquinol methylase